MSITEGDIFANFRYNNRTGLLVPSTITDERQVVAAFPEFSGDYGVTLNETPQTDIAGITQVMRVSDSQIFTHTNLATIGLTEYFFDYSNDMPILFFNAANNGEEFAIQYYGVGGAVNGKNLLRLVQDAGDSLISLEGKIKENTTTNKTVSSNITLGANLVIIHNLNITSNAIINSGTAAATFNPIIEIFGDLDVASGITLTLGRVMLIIHGNITGSGTISSPAGANGGNGRTAGGGGGGGGGGAGIMLVCFGTIAFTITIAPGKGGSGGLANQGANTAGTNGYVDFGGTGGTVVAAAGNGGGGGGGAGYAGGAGGNGANGATPATNATTYGAGGGGGSNSATTAGTGSIGLSANVFSIGAGGNGGAGGGSAANGQGGQTGSIIMYSQYTVSLPCTTNVTAISGGTAGSIVLNNRGVNAHGIIRLWAYYTKSVSAI